ncbi:Vesicle-trafficking protein SEC22a [Acropora cervicornis]|uniref:Vesicle-trafficking protein SEC22a n=1 Tax=Acropora cervicornis TaxID=6130 RepID=A0AAD9QPC5_ACRCE|nr:Vesicle-trafficking protein SEC22a [Acropora cervicornis]
MLRAKPGIELNFLLNLLSRTLIGCDNGPEWRAGELNDGTQAQQQSDWQALGVCFMTVCERAYPAVLVFSFIEELQREFMVTFQSREVQQAKRPYSLIEFDSFIQKTKQRYNNTRTLTSRLNLSEMSEDLHNNPPFEISLTELGTDNNKDIKTYKTGAGVCALLNFLRCFPFLNVIIIDKETDDTWFSAAGFFLAGILSCSQLYLLLYPAKWRILLARSLFALVLLLVYFLRNLRNIWQISFHLAVAVVILYQTANRQLEAKLPDYNV